MASYVKKITQNPMTKADLNHFHINVSDQDRSQRFYEAFFGFKFAFAVPQSDTKPIERKEVRFLVNDYGFQLGLDCHPDRRPVPDWFHLGFRLTTADAVREARQFLDENSISVSDDFTDTPDFVSFTCLDPDGYHIEIFWDSTT